MNPQAEIHADGKTKDNSVSFGGSANLKVDGKSRKGSLRIHAHVIYRDF